MNRALLRTCEAGIAPQARPAKPRHESPLDLGKGGAPASRIWPGIADYSAARYAERRTPDHALHVLQLPVGRAEIIS